MNQRLKYIIYRDEEDSLSFGDANEILHHDLFPSSLRFFSCKLLSSLASLAAIRGKNEPDPNREDTEQENPLTCSIKTPSFSSPTLIMVPSTGLTYSWKSLITRNFIDVGIAISTHLLMDSLIWVVVYQSNIYLYKRDQDSRSHSKSIIHIQHPIFT